ncbi:MAG: hypothetical protein Q7R82_01400 [Candidatus Daviesbacteria bacterium]|nr:hypothetical protein [Candidatus Daviesbacteria bacterium]
MTEQESPMQEFFGGRPSVEFSPRKVKLWHGMKPVDLTDCDRIIITDGTIEIHRGRELYLLCLDEEPFSISILCPPPFKDRRIDVPTSTVPLCVDTTNLIYN